jgi:hypothetical protein
MGNNEIVCMAYTAEQLEKIKATIAARGSDSSFSPEALATSTLKLS